MADITATLARLEALASAPKPWLASATLPNGEKRQYRAPTRAIANAWLCRLLELDVNDELGDVFLIHSPE